VTNTQSKSNIKDLLAAFAIAAVFSFVTTRIAFYLGFFVIVLALFAAPLLAAIIRWVAGDRQDGALLGTVAVGVILAGVVVAVLAYQDHYRYAAYYQLAYALLTAAITYIHAAGLKLELE